MADFRDKQATENKGLVVRIWSSRPIANFRFGPLDTGQPIPAPSSLAALQDLPEHDGWSFGVITIDPASLDDSTHRVNIMLPRRVLKRLDAMAKANGESRSGYIAMSPCSRAARFALDAKRLTRLEHPMPTKDDSPPSKAERAAQLRAARRAALEAKALRENLARRKAQTRARATAPANTAGGPEKCR